MTSTTTVLSIPAELTRPSRTLRLLARAALGAVLLWSDICGLPGLEGRDLTLSQQGLHAGDVPLDLPEPCVVVQLAGDVLEPEVEELLLGLGQTRLELLVVELAQLAGGGHQTCTSLSWRDTNLALM